MSAQLSHTKRAFKLGIILNLAYVIIEAFAGFVIDSISLLADATHNLTDVIALLIGWAGVSLAQAKPSLKHTYGMSRATIVAALISGIILFLAMGGITLEAINRFDDPHDINGWAMIIVAAIGVVINLMSALLFSHNRHQDLNVKAAYIHLMADAAVSVGVVIAGVGILNTGLNWLDPLTTLIIVIVILYSSVILIKDALQLSVDAVPENIDVDSVLAFLRTQPGVSNVHDLHIWPLSTTDTALTVHMVVPENNINDSYIANVVNGLYDRFSIGHATIQIEKGDLPGFCQQTHAHGVTRDLSDTIPK